MRHMLVRRILAAALCGTAGLAGLLISPATPVVAATPQCTTTVVQVHVDWDGVRAHTTLPATSGGSSVCWLAQGDISSAVTALQHALILCRHEGAPVISADGNFGPATKNALRYEQTADGITADGVYGSQSRTHMGWPTELGSCAFVG